jgi:hypothetical protein
VCEWVVCWVEGAAAAAMLALGLLGFRAVTSCGPLAEQGHAAMQASVVELDMRHAGKIQASTRSVVPPASMPASMLTGPCWVDT